MSLLLARAAQNHRNSGGDPYWSHVVSLLHFDGPNGSTTFTDQVSANTWTANGTAAITTSTYKFGGSSGLFPSGTISPISTPDSSALEMGTGDFTLEGWFLPGAPLTGFGVVYAKGLNTSGGMSLGISPTLITFRCNGITDNTATVSISTWTHIAVVRASGVVTIYVNGVSATSFSISFNNNDTSTLYLGSNIIAGDYHYSYSGNVDEFRLTKGIARYTANFTPPTAPFPNH